MSSSQLLAELGDCFEFDSVQQDKATVLQSIDQILVWSAGDGHVLFGEPKGAVFQMTRELEVRFFMSFKERLVHFAHAQQWLIGIGVDYASTTISQLFFNALATNPFSSPSKQPVILKLWNLASWEGAVAPHCAFSCPLNLSRKVGSTQATMIAVSPKMDLLVIGLANSSLFFCHGDVRRYCASTTGPKWAPLREATNSAQDDQLVGLTIGHVRPGTTIVCCITDRLVCSYVLNSENGQLTKTIVHDAEGCERRCWHFSQSNNQLIVAGGEMIHFYDLADCLEMGGENGRCHALGQGADKVQLLERQGQIALVTEQEAHIQSAAATSSSPAAAPNKTATVHLYDIESRCIAFFCSMPAPCRLFTLDSELYLLNAEGLLHRLIKKQLNEDRDRCQIDEENTLKKMINEAVFTDHMELIHDKFEELLTQQQNEQLGCMFDLCSHVLGAHRQLKQILEGYIEREGKAAIQQIAYEAFNDPKQYISCILRMYELFDKLVSQSFENDPIFVEAMDKAFIRIINNNQITQMARNASKSPQMLVLYCDQLLSGRGYKGGKVLEEVVTVFKYIEDKDVFETYYHKMLCKRLVNGGRINEEAEGVMIDKLSRECGFVYTSKLDRLLDDVAHSRDNTRSFRLMGKPGNVEFSVNIFAGHMWPLQDVASTLEVPQPLMDCMEAFRHYYESKYDGRKLNWVLQLGHGELVSLPEAFSAKYTFICNTQQITILMLYNQRDQWRLGELHAAIGTQFPREQLHAVLQSLTKTDLLRLTDAQGQPMPEGQQQMDLATVTDQHRLRLNTAFQNNNPKVFLTRHMSITNDNDDKKESEVVPKDVEENRRLVIQACIVRIMKMRKRLKHQQLVGEVLQQLTAQFQPKVLIIKKCIESLIEKEYLKRDEQDRELYEYVA